MVHALNAYPLNAETCVGGVTLNFSKPFRWNVNALYFHTPLYIPTQHGCQIFLTPTQGVRSSPGIDTSKCGFVIMQSTKLRSRCGCFPWAWAGSNHSKNVILCTEKSIMVICMSGVYQTRYTISQQYEATCVERT